MSFRILRTRKENAYSYDTLGKLLFEDIEWIDRKILHKYLLQETMQALEVRTPYTNLEVIV